MATGENNIEIAKLNTQIAAVKVTGWDTTKPKEERNDCIWNITANQMDQSKDATNADIADSMQELIEFNDWMDDGVINQSFTSDKVLHEGDSVHVIPTKNVIDNNISELETAYNTLETGFADATNGLEGLETAVGDAAKALRDVVNNENATEEEFQAAKEAYEKALEEFKQRQEEAQEISNQFGQLNEINQGYQEQIELMSNYEGFSNVEKELYKSYKTKCADMTQELDTTALDKSSEVVPALVSEFEGIFDENGNVIYEFTLTEGNDETPPEGDGSVPKSDNKNYQLGENVEFTDNDLAILATSKININAIITNTNKTLGTTSYGAPTDDYVKYSFKADDTTYDISYKKADDGSYEETSREVIDADGNKTTYGSGTRSYKGETNELTYVTHYDSEGNVLDSTTYNVPYTTDISGYGEDDIYSRSYITTDVNGNKTTLNQIKDDNNEFKSTVSYFDQDGKVAQKVEVTNEQADILIQGIKNNEQVPPKADLETVETVPAEENDEEPIEEDNLSGKYLSSAEFAKLTYDEQIEYITNGDGAYFVSELITEAENSEGYYEYLYSQRDIYENGNEKSKSANEKALALVAYQNMLSYKEQIDIINQAQENDSYIANLPDNNGFRGSYENLAFNFNRLLSDGKTLEEAKEIINMQLDTLKSYEEAQLAYNSVNDNCKNENYAKLYSKVSGIDSSAVEYTQITPYDQLYTSSVADIQYTQNYYNSIADFYNNSSIDWNEPKNIPAGMNKADIVALAEQCAKFENSGRKAKAYEGGKESYDAAMQLLKYAYGVEGVTIPTTAIETLKTNMDILTEGLA